MNTFYLCIAELKGENETGHIPVNHSEKPRSSNQGSVFRKKKTKPYRDQNSKSSRRDKAFIRNKTKSHSDANNSKSSKRYRVFGRNKSKSYSDENSRTATANFLIYHDERYKVSQTRPIYKTMGEEALKIVQDTFELLGDDKFHGKILPSGSFFEDLKVGKPDEFDFLAQITSLSGKKCDIVPSDRPGFVHVTVKEPFFDPWKKCMALVCKHKIRADQCKGCKNINPSDIGCTLVLAPEKVQAEFRKIIDNALEEVDLPKNWRHRGVEEPNCGGFRRHGPANMFLFYYDIPDGEAIEVSLDITLSIGLGTPVDEENINFYPVFRIPLEHRFQPWYLDVLEKGVEGEFPLQLIPLYSKLHVRTGSYGDKDCWRVSCSLVEREFLNRFHPGTEDSLPKRCIRLCKWLRDKYLTEEINERKKENIQSLNNSIANIPQEIHSMNKNVNEDANIPQDSMNKNVNEEHSQVNHDRYSDATPLEELSELSLTSTEVREAHKIGEHGGETTTNPDYKTLPETEREIQSVNYADFITDEDIPELLGNFKKVFTPSASFHIRNFQSVSGFPLYSKRVSMKYLDREKSYVPFKIRKDRNRRKKRRTPQPGIQTTEVSEMQLNPHSAEYYGPKAYVSSIEIKTIIMYFMERHPFPEQWTENQIPVIITKVFNLIHHMYQKNGCVLNYFFDVPVIAPQELATRETAVKKLVELIEKMGSDWIPIQEEFPRTSFTEDIPRFPKIPHRLYFMAMKSMLRPKSRPMIVTTA